MTRPTRLVTITYGGLTIGAGTSYDLHRVHRITESYGRFELEATVVFRGASSTAAQVLDAAFRSAFTKPDQSDFDVTIDSVSWLAYSHSADTWLDSRSELDSVDEFRTKLSRGYRVRITADLPADLAGRNARASSNVSVDQDQAGNLHLSITADYTSSGGTTAYDQAIAQWDTYVGVVQAAVGGGTWLPSELVKVGYDDQNKHATISAGYVQDRALTISYGGVTVGTGTAYDLREIQGVSESYESQDVSFVVSFDAASTTALEVLDVALRAAFTKPDDDLVVTLNSVVWLSLSHSAHTGFNARATMTPLAEYVSTKSYGYRITVSVGLPADLAGRAGKRTSRWTTTTEPTGRKLLTVEALYTALSGVGTALATAQADFDTYVASLQTIVGGTWVEAQGVELTPDDQNKLCQVRASFQQRLINDSASGAADSDLEIRAYNILVSDPEAMVAIGSGARPIARVSVSFGADVATSAGLAATYTSKVLPYLKTLVTAHTDLSGTPILAASDVDFDPWRWVIQGTVTFLVPHTGLFSASRRVTEMETTGRTLVPRLNRKKPWAKVEYVGPQFRTREVEILTLEKFGGAQHDSLVEIAHRDAVGAGFVPLKTRTVEADAEVAKDGGGALKLIERATVLSYEFGGSDFEGGVGATRARRR